MTWGRFVERESGRAVWVFNTHFDHESQPSRLRSIRDNHDGRYPFDHYPVFAEIVPSRSGASNLRIPSE